MKTCFRCGEEKPLGDFHASAAERDGKQRACKKCCIEYVTTRYDRNRAIINEAKDRPCMDCDVGYPPYVMDFDHVRGTKRFTIGSDRGLTSNLDELRAEIAKCDVVCANCHRERTFREELQS